MEITIADAATETTFTTPGGVGRQRDFPCRITFTIVDVQLQRFAFVALDQGEQIFGIAEQRIGADDVIRIRSEAGERRWRMLLHIEYMPHIFVGFIESAKANTQTE